MKKLLASLLAMSMVFAFTACSLTGDDDDDSSKKKSKNSSSSSVVDDSDKDSEADDSSKADDASSEADADSTADESSEADDDSSEEAPAVVVDDSSEADASSDNAAATGDGYAIDVDAAAWKDISSTVSGVNAAYSYIGDTSDPYLATANFNIIAQGGAGTAKVTDFVDVIKKQYEAMGYEITNSEQITFNGYDAYKVETTVTQSGLTMKMNQVVIIDNGTAYIISYGSESSVFDKIKPEFEKVLGTFKLS